MKEPVGVAHSGVIFDLDGTLVDSEPFWVRGFSTGLSRILEVRGYGFHHLDPSDMRKFAGGRVPDTIADILQSLRLEGRIDDSETDAIVQDVLNFVTDQFVADPAPIPEAVSTARALHADGVPMAIASSSAPSFIEAVLDVLKLQDVFPVRVSAVELPRGKPDPAVYLLALQQMGLPALRTVAVEDSRVGVAAAVNAKMRCLWYLPGETEGSLAGRADLTSQLESHAANPSDILRLVTVTGHLRHSLLAEMLDEMAKEGSGG